MSQEPQPQSKPLNRWMWWLCFGVATYVMSLWFQAFRDFTADPGMPTALNWLATLGLLMAIVFLMMYDSYVLERNRDKIAHPVRVFEWLYRRRILFQGGGEHHESQ